MPDEHMSAQEIALGYFNNISEIFDSKTFLINGENIVLALSMTDVTYLYCYY